MHKKLQNCQRYIDAKPLREAATENWLLPAVMMHQRCENGETLRVQPSHPRPLRFRNLRTDRPRTIAQERHKPLFVRAVSRSRTGRHSSSPIPFAQFLILRIRETVRFAPRLTRERTAQCLRFGILPTKIALPATPRTMTKLAILRRIKPMPAPVELRFGAR